MFVALVSTICLSSQWTLDLPSKDGIEHSFLWKKYSVPRADLSRALLFPFGKKGFGRLCIRIQGEVLDAPRQLFNGGLAVEPRRIERGMTEQGCQSHEVARVLSQIGLSECVTKCMCAGVLRNQIPTACITNSAVDHLTHGRCGERSSLLTPKDG